MTANITNLEKLSDEKIVALAKDDPKATDFILEKYKSFVILRTRPYYINGGDTADIVQEGMIGLFKAVKTYNPEKGASFKTYAGICIDRQIIDAVKAATRKKHSPLNTSVSLEEDMGRAVPFYDISDLLTKIKTETEGNLSSFEAKVWKLYMEGNNPEEIGEKLEKDSKAIHNAMERIKQKIKEFLIKEI